MSGVSKLKKEEVDGKKRIIAKKMGGNPNKPNSWTKKVEGRNKGHENNEDKFTKGDRRKITKANEHDHGKEPEHSWET